MYIGNDNLGIVCRQLAVMHVRVHHRFGQGLFIATTFFVIGVAFFLSIPFGQYCNLDQPSPPVAFR